MPIVKVSEATNIQLNWVVASIEEGVPVAEFLTLEKLPQSEDFWKYNYSTNWSQGGPIIEREGIATMPMGDDGEWLAITEPCVFDTTPDATERSWEIGGLFAHRAETPLIAAMRCFICSRLGETVEVPEELCQS